MRAGCAGQPVSSENQTPHIKNAQPLKNSSANQSIQDDIVRRMAGKYMAASTANAGVANKSARSLCQLKKICMLVSAAMDAGTKMCGLRHQRRQTNKATTAIKAVGHKNHATKRPKESAGRICTLSHQLLTTRLKLPLCSACSPMLVQQATSAMMSICFWRADLSWRSCSLCTCAGACKRFVIASSPAKSKANRGPPLKAKPMLAQLVAHMALRGRSSCAATP